MPSRSPDNEGDREGLSDDTIEGECLLVELVAAFPVFDTGFFASVKIFGTEAVELTAPEVVAPSTTGVKDGDE